MAGERSHAQPVKLICVGIVFFSLLISSILRGSKRTESVIGVKTCSAADWSLYASFFLISIGVLVFTIIYLKRHHAKKIKLGY